MKRLFLALLALALLLVGCSPSDSASVPEPNPPAAPVSEERLLTFDGRRYSYEGNAEDLSVQEDRITLLLGGTYRLSGTLTEGALRISAPPDATVRLILDSVSITSSYYPPLLIEEAACVILESEEGSVNRLTDAAREGEDAPETRGCLVSACRLILCGTGTLCVSGRQSDGVICRGDLHLSETVLTLSAPEAGISVRDRLCMNSGSLTVSAARLGLVADGGSAAHGSMELLGGRLALSCSETALVASRSIYIGQIGLSIIAPTRIQSPTVSYAKNAS